MHIAIEIMRIFLATLVLGGMSRHLGRTVIRGLRAGAIHHGDPETVCSRRRNPPGFRALAALFTALVALFATYRGNVAMDVVKRLA